MTLNPNQTTREVAIRHPWAVPVFESLGIDYCCGGARPIKDSCERAHVDWDHLIELLQNVEAPPDASVADWNMQALDALTTHIVSVHHAFVRRTVPQIHQWLEKVVAKHGAAHPELKEIQQLFTAMAEELFAHMMKEERILFPHLDRLAAAQRGETPASQAFFGSAFVGVDAPISRMLAEHDDAGELLAKIRALSGNHQPPTDACPTYRALYQGLADFERDLHQHVHLENNILFPRALDLERRVLSDQEQEHVRR